MKNAVTRKRYFCQMIVDDSLIENLAHLSRLRFSPKELVEIKSDLEKMIGFISKLNELDTTGVPPRLHMNEHANILRPDIVIQEISREEALLNSPVPDKTFFKVPKVIKNKA